MTRLALLALALTLSLGGMARAEVASKDFQVIGRTLSLLSSRPSGRVTVAIIHDPSQPASRAEADSVAALLGDGLTVGNLTLVPVLVPANGLTRLDGAVAAWVTQGLDGRHEAIFEATRARSLVSISQDFTCVRAGHCVMGLETKPQVQIVLNRQAAESSRVSFASAFRLLVSEI